VNFRLVDSRWDGEFDAALSAQSSELRIICPFIKTGAVSRLLNRGKPKMLRVLTRFNLDDFCAGASDVAALQLLLENGGRIRGVRNLHAKLYLFGTSRVIVTSANLTDAALIRNHEFGFIAEDDEIIRRCGEYFEKLWSRAGGDVSASQLTDWDQEVTDYLASGAPPAVTPQGLGDKGVNVSDWMTPASPANWVGEAKQAFVKIFGESHSREDCSASVLDEVRESGCHWACTYPRDKRPRRVHDGGLMFMGRLVRNPNDILVYGRAVGMQYQRGRDDASSADIKRRDWKRKWPHYVRVHHAEFIAGTLSNGISLNEMMETLGQNSFASTQRNAKRGKGNVDPRRAYRQQAAVELSPQGLMWMNERFERAYTRYGKLPNQSLAQLDWPERLPRTEGGAG
jgi:hypothetical protein